MSLPIESPCPICWENGRAVELEDDGTIFCPKCDYATKEDRVCA